MLSILLTLLQVLIAVYLVVVVYVVRREVTQMDEEGVDRIIMIDKKGRTGIKTVKDVLSNDKEVLM